jgi:hypothetical protein
MYKPRTCNAAVDKLAKIGSDLQPGGVIIWPNEHPAIVNSLVTADLQSVMG